MTDQAPDIEIRSLFKIFGADGAAYVEAVKQGMSKKELNARHRHVLGLRDINLTMHGGCIQVIMGLSGSGKSTLIRHINRLIEPTAGEVVIAGTDVVKMTQKELLDFRRYKTAMVFQKFGLLPHRTVFENTVYGLEVRGLSAREQRDTAMRWIERVGLKGFESKYPNQLSGGMQQRVGLARALATDAPILLMDEAFSALDPLIRMDMQTVLLDIQKDVGKTIVFITHDLDEALRLGDSIAILRDGEMIQVGTAQDIVLNPADDYVANFVRHVNRGKVIHVDSIMVPPFPGTPSSGSTVSLGTTLEDAAEVLARGDADGIDVMDPSGERVGHVALRQIVSAMVTPHFEASA
ncbi:quaternary amine ABC transporter ATP-binding protein [Paracoccus denitrificans]|uniref:quaternary amine ABC transporter ATP-binding protein n=1 Tax=Paracoccus denitrificans TaxID=266 RepID=UPI000CEC43D0|nr:glycine betaine/L-proline ABC transporter ATP-binding protein [Paracoccus denitrificans]